MTTYDPSSVLLTNRVAIVTGAGGGLGYATALLFARFGAKLAICDRVPDTLAKAEADIEAIGQPVLARVLDVRDDEAVTAFIADIAEEYNGVDILVNNAGGTFWAPFMDLNEKGEATLIAENFTQATRFIRGVVPLMHGGGAIVNLTSIEAHHGAPGFSIYGAMKAGLAHLTKTLALELGPLNIRVNAIAPDAIRTGGEGNVRQEMLGGAATYDPAVVPPLGHLGTAEDGAGVALFLACDLSSFVTGCTIHLDGGNRAAGGWRRVDVAGRDE
jgi:3-oxoacyl-[acyl-carrier protein] reductase